MSQEQESSAALPASFAQELLWLTDRASAGSTAYNVPRTRRVRGLLHLATLVRVFRTLMERHEILRTTYANDGDSVVQVVHDHMPLPFDVIDLSAYPPAQREAEATRLVRERAARPFDLARDAMLRVTVLRMDDHDHVLLLESHHIAFDGWSRDVLFREMDALYTAFSADEDARLEPLPIQYADYAIWQREELAGARLAELLAWWRNELDEADHVLALPTDFRRPAVSRFDSISASHRFTGEQHEAIRALGQKHGATPYMVLLAAFATVLHRYTAQQDILIGSPIAGRARSETEGLIGYFANTIVQRARFRGNPDFARVLRSLRESALGAYDHQDVPFEKLALEFEGRPSTGQAPLFQVVMTQLDATAAPPARLGDLTLEPFATEMNATKFDLTLFTSTRGDELVLTLRGRADLHFRESIERLLGHIATVLSAVTQNDAIPVAELPLLSEAERAQLSQWNQTAVNEGTPDTVVSLFEHVAASRPDKIALMGEHVGANVDRMQRGVQPLTYAQVNARANQLAHHLTTLGVTRGQIVGLSLDRCNEAVVAMLGIMKAGASYVPLAIEAPAARVAAQLAECEATVVVTGRAPLGLPAGATVVELDFDSPTLRAQPETNPPSSVTASDRAYVLFTSGSTGVPKGVAVTHANIVHYTRAISRVLADMPATEHGDALSALAGKHFGLASTLAADLGNTSLYPSLLGGGTLHVFTRDLATEPARFAEYVETHPLDVLKITPNHLRALTAGRTGAELHAVLPRMWIVTGGETLPLALARSLLMANGPRVLNHYGPTETTVGVLTFEASGQSLDAAEKLGANTVPLGRPLANTHSFVVDGNLQELPVGIPGELIIGGAGVTDGYINRTESTAERFVTLRGERVYRTGDRVRRLPDGTIEFLGRNDDQVKVRGYRVELGEIEHMLRTHSGVDAAAVLLRDDAQGEPRLLAYVVAKPDGYAVAHAVRPNSESLLEWLAARLPAYMVPAAIVMMPTLPLTANGKVDTRSLPEPDAAEAAARALVAPSSPIEVQLAQIWKDVLKKDAIGVHDSFVELGGHSLLAIRILGRISKGFGVRLSLRTLFDAPTIAQLAEVVDLEQQLAAVDALANDPSAG